MLEVVLLLIKKNSEIKVIEIFDDCFFCTAYADDTSFFLKEPQSIAYLAEIFNTDPLFSGLKPNLTKCKAAEIGAFKVVQLAICGLK